MAQELGEDMGPTNHGRWGPDDQRGTLNLLTPAMIVAGAQLVRQGRVISLGVPIGPGGPVFPGRDRTWHYLRYKPGPFTGYADDLITMNSHSGTHLDALGHNFLDGRMYNGFTVQEHVSSWGVTRNAITNVGAIVGRGILLDIARFRGVEHLEAGDAIRPAELDACARQQGITPRSGDICLVRSGWYRVFERDRARFDAGEPGLSVQVAAWFHDHQLVALGMDNGAIDVLPAEPGVRPFGLHPRVIFQQGGYLIEYLDLEELADARVNEFLFVAAPLKIVDGAGSPINPLAIF